VVPVHFDLHHNFLLQIEGTKEVMVGTFSDRNVEQREVNRYFDKGSNNVRDIPDRVTRFELSPGEGVYIPPYAMHWVRAGDATSIGVSCGLRTVTTDRTRVAHQFNSKLRRRGLHPRAAGASAGRDRAKAAAFTQARRVRNRVRRSVTRQPA
jgi:ribosomal protein L16 Arg81 hydroxylase